MIYICEKFVNAKVVDVDKFYNRLITRNEVYWKTCW